MGRPLHIRKGVIMEKSWKYKYETHLHTSEGSACGRSSGAEQARRYKELGYDGIIVTDHFFNGNCAVKEYTDWKDRVDQYCLGYENAKAEGDKIGLKVFFGIEYSYQGADLLTYGIDKQWLYDNPDVLDISFYEYSDRVHRDGGMLIHAHPFREAWYIHEIRLLPQWIDGVEIYNTGNHKEVWNEKAEWYAIQYGFKTTGGTDNHDIATAADRLSGIYSQVEFTSVQDYIDAFKAGRVTPIIPAKRSSE